MFLENVGSDCEMYETKTEFSQKVDKHGKG